MIIIFTLLTLTNKYQSNNYIALLDTDSETPSQKINCTTQQLYHKYNHADQSLLLLNRNVQHFVVQDSKNQIKEEYIIYALNYLMSDPQVSIILIPIASARGLSKTICDLIQSIIDQYNILFYISLHPLNQQIPLEDQNIFYIKSSQGVSASEKTIIYGKRSII